MSKANVEVRHIENLTGAEVDAMVKILLQSFDGSMPIAAMTGGNKDLEDSLFRSMILAGNLAGRLYVVEDAKHQILSMALWYAPGSSLFSTEAERALGFNDFISKLDDKTCEWWGTTYPQEIDGFIETWLPIPLADSWYLNLIGTDPVHQRKGYATELLNHVVKNVQSHNILAFCSTTQENANFYANAGFPIRGEYSIPAGVHTFPIFGHSQEV